jgi:hypothetical protein
MNPLIPLKKSIPVFLVVLILFALLPASVAVIPPPDGGYPGQNTAEGTDALFSLTETGGGNNTAMGFQALFSNTAGSANTATGQNALFSNTTGNFNTANGQLALFSNTDGSDNTATGEVALYSNRTGNFNTATGEGALFGNRTGDFNTATGLNALATNTHGNQNTATGSFALFPNTTGNFNTANGFFALTSNTTGNHNTAVGFQALMNNTGSNNIALGSNAGADLTTGSNNIDIGAPGVAGDSNVIRIGRVGVQTSAYIRGISGATVPSGVSVIVDTNGHLGTVQSAARFKEAVKPMDKASEAILTLKPVTFRYKDDPDGIPQFGLVAEDVEKVHPDLVVRDSDGKIYTVRYDAVNAMLLNEFLKEHRKNEKQEVTIAGLEKQIEALAAGLQKVSAQLEATKPAPQTASNNQ